MVYHRSLYDPDLDQLVQEATTLLLRTTEGRTFLRIVAPVGRCSAEMQQFYWLVVGQVLRQEAQRVPGDQEVPVLPGQADDGL